MWWTRQEHSKGEGRGSGAACQKRAGSPRAIVSCFLLITLLLVPQILNSFYVRSNFSRAGVSREAEKDWCESKRLQHMSQLCPISFHSKRQNSATELLANDLVMSEFRAVHAFHVWEWGAGWRIIPGASFSSHGKQQLWDRQYETEGRGELSYEQEPKQVKEVKWEAEE